MIEWKSQYSVENRQLDEQHKKLFELVNEILEAMKTENRGMRFSSHLF